MTLTADEIAFLSTWAREEWEPACYRVHAHQLQLAHGVSGAALIALIKVWTNAEKKKDRELLDASTNPTPTWPWGTAEEFRIRLEEASKQQALQPAPVV